MRVLMLALLLAAPVPAAAESLLRTDSGEQVGWPAYDGDGKLIFVDCQGATRTLAQGGSFEATEQRCPSEPAPFSMTGTIAGVEPERARLELREQGPTTDGEWSAWLTPAEWRSLWSDDPTKPIPETTWRARRDSMRFEKADGSHKHRFPIADLKAAGLEYRI